MTIQEMRNERMGQGRMFVYAVVAIVVLTVCAVIGAIWLTPVAVENKTRIEDQWRQPAREYERDQRALEQQRRQQHPTEPVSHTGNK